MKILSITGNRADYDLLSYLYRYFNSDPDIDFKLIVTGAHLTIGYESSIAEIKKDGNDIIMEIENILHSDTKTSRAKSTGILLMTMVDVIKKFAPDVIIAPGDREEVIAASIAAAYMKTPFLHFFGGENALSGHVDNLIRHAASKMATAHFVATQEHKDRLLAMGEEEGRIFLIGSVALDKFIEEPFQDIKKIHKLLGIHGFEDYALLIYHPPAEIEGYDKEIDFIMRTLKNRDIKTIVSYPNTDFNNSEIHKIYEKYNNDENFFFYNNLDRNTFINIYRNAIFQIGNSSSGVCEAASIPIPVINVGTRQKNRGNTENILFVDKIKEQLNTAIDTAMSEQYRVKLKNVKNIYGDGKSSKRAYKIIKNIDFSKMLLKKYDPIQRKKSSYGSQT